MDYSRSLQMNFVSRHRLQNSQSSPALHQLQTPGRRGQQPYSSPLPQTQWSEIPSPYLPRGLIDSEERYHQHGQRYARPQATHPPARIHERYLEQTPPKRKRRVRGFRDLLQPQGLEEGPGTAVDVSMLYPQMNPYTNSNRQSSHSTHSAPEELERYHNRTVSQNSAPGYLDPSSHSDFAPPMNAPRSPTYPPAGRRRMHSATGLGDAAFADEAEYRLFVEATAGLGPEQSFRPFDPVSQFPVSPLSPSPRRTQSERISTIGPASPRDIVSPLSETPTTRFALQHLAQMPHGSTHPSLEPLQTTHSAVDMWLQPPSAEPLDFIDEQFAALDLDLDDDHLNDELPGYAESQAQAQQHQRAEAARRAQELQMRWQMSGGRRGV